MPRPKPPAQTSGSRPRTPGMPGPAGGRRRPQGGGGAGLSGVGLLRPRAPPEPQPAAATSPNFFFPGQTFPGLSWGRRGRGASWVSLQTGEDHRTSTCPRPVGAGPRPPPRALADLEGGTGAGGRSSGLKPYPLPRGAPERATAPSAWPSGSIGQKELIIDWAMGSPRPGPARRIVGEEELTGLSWRRGKEGSLLAAARARVGWSSVGRPQGQRRLSGSRAGAAGAAAHRCAAA